MDLGNPHELQTKQSTKIIGPWRCEACGQLSQYAEVTWDMNTVYCRNESCGYTRIVDKRHSRIVENDGSAWAFDNAGNKWRVRL